MSKAPDGGRRVSDAYRKNRTYMIDQTTPSGSGTIMQEKKPNEESKIGMIEKNETLESAISYGAGCASLLLGWVCDASDLWQALALFLGCIVVFIRALHDGARLYRFIRYGK